MNAGRQDAPPLMQLNPEWERLQLLGHCLSYNRQGLAVADSVLGRLRGLQSQVEALRRPGSVWERLVGERLSPMEWDVLSAVVGPELEPRLGWMYIELQGGQGQPYPSRALIQELLALEPHESELLRRILSPEAPLLRGRLLVGDPGDPWRPLQPDPGLVSRLEGRPWQPPPPPGAEPVPIRAGWDDLVLPPDRLRMLREFLLWITHRQTVVELWGGQRVGGPVALFAGPSGTGKTLAASVIASTLGWPLYRVDLGRLVSKYVGETEANLNRLFEAAHARPMVLQFDEADALFARRGEVKEARDRYANMEVSHLLTRIEAHEGPCILTTNLRRQMDAAFTRRLQMVVEFPRPDLASRAALWERLLPLRAPREPEVAPQRMAAAVALTGGQIRNAALHAAYLAAGEGTPIALRHIALGVWRELAKDGHEYPLRELGELAEHLPGGLADA
ncbi:MAG: ATP-binding protein [Burkholderiales bacterium]|nr:ATP-binding protein [Burkholderiales bacterium]